MPDLSACYFCGTAVDAPVREYDVVPDLIDSTSRRTASLCPACKDKLASVLRDVVAAGVSGDVPDEIELQAVSTDRRVQTGSTTPDDASKSASDAESSEAAVSDADAPDGIAITEEDAASSSEHGDPVDVIDTGDRNDGAAGDELSAEEALSEAETAVETMSDGETAERTATDDATDGEQVVDVTNDEQTTDVTDGDQTTDATENQADDASDDTADRPQTSTYNRVVRLLQNREFPVNRSEFVDLASSAYDIDPDACERVLDHAIERGELVEGSGMLTKPDT